MTQVTASSDRIIPVTYKGVAYNIRSVDKRALTTLLSRSELNILLAEDEKELKNILGNPSLSFRSISSSMQTGEPLKEQKSDGNQKVKDAFADIDALCKLQDQYDQVY